MSEENPADRAWELMEKIGLCMLVTQNDGDVRARPMGPTIKREDHAIYFLTDVASSKDNEIEANPSVLLAFSDTHGQKYVALTGTASVTNDRAKIKEIWTPIVRAWWDNADDPSIRLLTVRPESAEFWDSPGTIASYATMIAAAVTGTKPKVGDNKKVPL